MVAWKCLKRLGGWMVVENEVGDRLWLSFSLSLVKLNNDDLQEANGEQRDEEDQIPLG